MISELFETQAALPPWLDPAKVDRYDLHVHNDQDAVDELTGKFIAGAQYYTVTAIGKDGEALKQWRHERYTPARAQYFVLSFDLRRAKEGLPRHNPTTQADQLGFQL